MFFAKTLHYYQWRKELEGEIDHMENIPIINHALDNVNDAHLPSSSTSPGSGCDIEQTSKSLEQPVEVVSMPTNGGSKTSTNDAWKEESVMIGSPADCSLIIAEDDSEVTDDAEKDTIPDAFANCSQATYTISTDDARTLTESVYTESQATSSTADATTQTDLVSVKSKDTSTNTTLDASTLTEHVSLNSQATSTHSTVDASIVTDSVATESPTTTTNPANDATTLTDPVTMKSQATSTNIAADATALTDLVPSKFQETSTNTSLDAATVMDEDENGNDAPDMGPSSAKIRLSCSSSDGSAEGTTISTDAIPVPPTLSDLLTQTVLQDDSANAAESASPAETAESPLSPADIETVSPTEQAAAQHQLPLETPDHSSELSNEISQLTSTTDTADINFIEQEHFRLNNGGEEISDMPGEPEDTAVTSSPMVADSPPDASGEGVVAEAALVETSEEEESVKKDAGSDSPTRKRRLPWTPHDDGFGPSPSRPPPTDMHSPAQVRLQMHRMQQGSAMRGLHLQQPPRFPNEFRLPFPPAQRHEHFFYPPPPHTHRNHFHSHDTMSSQPSHNNRSYGLTCAFCSLAHRSEQCFAYETYDKRLARIAELRL
ncbi:hypothetical protein PENTCL1PPCAC_4738 [Pristionchus entomophagus]|uniref:Uncharacterized protein n=1 Tax=Pristionchus entomophagus TaxID=358040 RepID=A0AAV5SHM3_9BILA|nr:hypothetical protein PENTCL1PPCAC_4738 [Pristionchus entomophagus]